MDVTFRLVERKPNDPNSNCLAVLVGYLILFRRGKGKKKKKKKKKNHSEFPTKHIHCIHFLLFITPASFRHTA